MLLLSLFCFIYLFYSVPPHFFLFDRASGTEHVAASVPPAFPTKLPQYAFVSLYVCVCMCWPKRLAIKPIFRQTKSWERGQKGKERKKRNLNFLLTRVRKGIGKLIEVCRILTVLEIYSFLVYLLIRTKALTLFWSYRFISFNV